MQLVAATTRPDGSPSFAYHHDGAKGGDGDEPRGSRMSQEDSSWSQIVNLYSQVRQQGHACDRRSYLEISSAATPLGIGRKAQRAARVLYAAFP